MTDWQTKDGSHTRIHPIHGEAYHNKEGAWSECLAVFLEPVVTEMQLRAQTVWRVLDAGFGLGLNWLCFVEHVLCHDLALEICSLENDASLLALPEPKNLAGRVSLQALHLLAEFKKNQVAKTDRICARLFLDDAKATLRQWQSSDIRFNIVLQDAFSPRVNPDFWDAEYFAMLSSLCEPNAIFTTYSAASAIRRMLEANGFLVQKFQGFGGKRERIVAIKK